ncbi:hypothetical protein RFI_07148, partial [Reticulomyxa filosa]
FSQPRVTYHPTSSIPVVAEIHDLLRDRDARLFFVSDEDLRRLTHSASTYLTEKSISLDLQATNSIHGKSNGVERLSSFMAKAQINDKIRRGDSFQKKKKKKVPMEEAKMHQQKTNAEDENNNGNSNNGGDNKKPELVFAVNEGEVSFDWGRFLLEFVYNALDVVGLPLVIWLEGVTGARSRCYWGLDYGSTSVAGHFWWMLHWLVNALFLIHPQRDLYGTVIICYNFLYIARLVIIGIKWGCYVFFVVIIVLLISIQKKKKKKNLRVYVNINLI